MEQREIWGLPLGYHNDSIFKVCYLRFLTERSFESIKITSRIEDYRFHHVIQPYILINAELVKTKKNWILKHINQTEQIAKPLSYKDFLLIEQYCTLTTKHIREGQETNILSWVIECISKISATPLSPHEYEKELLIKLGF